MKNLRLLVGMAIWVAILGGTVWFLGFRATKANTGAFSQLANFAKGPSQYIEINSDSEYLMAVADPIFMLEPDGTYKRIGEIKDLDILPDSVRYVGMNGQILNNFGETKHSVAMFYQTSPEITVNHSITMHETPASLEWVIKEMTKDGAWEEYQADLQAAFKEHGAEIMEEFRPVLEAGLRDAAIVVGQDLKVAFEARRERLEDIAKRYENELVRKKIVPLIQEEILPIVKRNAEPTLDEVGSEIWQRASLWRFGWRAAYDKLPLPKKELTRKEWDRFVEDEVVPILQAHVDDFIEVQKNILTDVTRNKKVRATFRDSARQIMEDKEIREILEEIFVEVFVKNPRLKKVVTDHWQSKQTQQAVSTASDKFERTIVRISEKMFGTPKTQITPSFARVLRNQVLRKDSRWFIVHAPDPTASYQFSGPAKSLSLTMGVTGNENPFVQSHEMKTAK